MNDRFLDFLDDMIETQKTRRRMQLFMIVLEITSIVLAFVLYDGWLAVILFFLIWANNIKSNNLL